MPTQTAPPVMAYDPSIKTTIRGVEYPSRAAAARALGVSREAVVQALRRGTVDRVGLPRSTWDHDPRRGRRGDGRSLADG